MYKRDVLEKISMLKNPNTSEFWNKRLVTISSIPRGDFITRDRIANVDNLIPNKDLSVLDIGSGYGFLEQKLARKESIKLFCIDISHKGIKKLKDKYIGHFLVASCKAIPFQTRTFDFVCLLEVLEHLFEHEAKLTYSEINRLLKRDGKLIVTVPLYDEARSNHPSGHVRMYIPNRIKSEIVSNGFEIISTKVFFAFRKHYFLKKILNSILGFNKYPNNILIFARKR